MSKIEIRKRLNSLEDYIPTSDTSDGTASELYDWSNEKTTTSQHQLNQQNSLAEDHENENCEKTNQILTSNERDQIENFFSGIGTEIFVSSSLANLYEGGKTTTNEKDNNWRLIYTGIPIILFDKGSARSRTTPQITICLAERGTCFALWRDIIDNYSEYQIIGPTFHTMRFSTNHDQTIGFSFDCNDAANNLWQHIEKLLNDHENISTNTKGNNKKKKNQQKKIKPLPLPPKTQISNPCQFHHVTNVNAKDCERYYSLQAYVQKSNDKYR